MRSFLPPENFCVIKRKVRSAISATACASFNNSTVVKQNQTQEKSKIYLLPLNIMFIFATQWFDIVG